MATCTISALFTNQDGSPRPGVRVSVYVLPVPVTGVLEREATYVSEDLLEDDGETPNDDAGKVSFDIVQGTCVRISVLHWLSRELVVPAEDTADLFALMAAAPDPFVPVPT